MLNIIKQKKRENELKIKKSEGKLVGVTKYFPPATHEWKDSIYTFNKNTSKIFPVANNYIFNIIKSYLNMFSKILDKRNRIPRMRKWKRRRYGRQIWISKPELKYSNEKIIINLYVYNRQYAFLLKKLSKKRLTWGKRLKYKIRKKRTLKNNKMIIYQTKFYKDKFLKVINGINAKRSGFLNSVIKLKKLVVMCNSKEKIELVRNLMNKLNKKSRKYKYLDLIINLSESKIFKIFNRHTLIHIIHKYYSRLIKKILKYQLIYLRNKQIILFNKSKFKNVHILPLKNLIQKIYRKKIEFNFISLKRYYHNSSILAQIVAVKINYRKKTNRPLRVIKTSIRKTQVYKFNKKLLWEDHTLFMGKQNHIIANFLKKRIKKIGIKRIDYLNNILNSNQPINNNLNLTNLILNSTKNKVMSGIRVQASGRITRRLIAQRATYKVRYKGTLKDIDSSYRGLSTVILKGHEKSTLQYSHLDYKRRIGAFGVKGWVNSYL